MFGVCIVGFLSGLIFCTPMGYDLRNVFSKGSFSWNMHIIALLQVILVGWVYGLDQFFKDLDDMELPLRHYMTIYLRIALKYASPVVFTILLIVEWIHGGKNLGQEGVSIPSILEHLVTFASVVFLPIFAGWEIFKIYQKSENNRSFKTLLEPTRDWYKN